MRSFEEIKSTRNNSQNQQNYLILKLMISNKEVKQMDLDKIFMHKEFLQKALTFEEISKLCSEKKSKEM